MAVNIKNANLSGGPSASGALPTKKAAPVVPVASAAPVAEPPVVKATPSKAKPKPKQQAPVESLVGQAETTAQDPSVKQLAAVNKQAEAVAVAIGSTVLLTPDQTEELQGMVDEYCHLSDEIAALNTNPIYQRFDEVATKLKAFVADHVPQAVEFTAQGTDCWVEFSACSKTARKIVDLAAVRDAVGDEVFLGMVNISVTTAQKYLTGEQIDKVCAPQGYTSTRKMIAKFAPKAK